MHAYVNQKNSFAARIKAAGCSLLTSSGIVFKGTPYGRRMTFVRSPFWWKVDAGTDPCLVARSHCRASAKLTNSEARSSGSPRPRSLRNNRRLRVAHLTRSAQTQFLTHTGHTIKLFRPAATLVAKFMTHQPGVVSGGAVPINR